MEAIILAGGRGARLGKLTDDLPKPMVPVHGRPFLELLMRRWKREGATRFIISVGYRYEKIEEHFGQAFEGIPVVYCREEKPLGTGGALLRSMEFLENEAECLMVNGDTYFDVDLASLQQFHKKSGSAFTLALFEIGQPDRYEAVETGPDGRITAFLGRDQQGGLANGGVYLLNPAVIRRLAAALPEVHSLERDGLPAWVASGESIYGFVSTGTFLDIGIPEDYERAEKIIPSA